MAPNIYVLIVKGTGSVQTVLQQGQNGLAYLALQKSTNVKCYRIDQELENYFRLFGKCSTMRLHHSPDASTFPGFKVVHFVCIMGFSEGILNCTSF